MSVLLVFLVFVLICCCIEANEYIDNVTTPFDGSFLFHESDKLLSSSGNTYLQMQGDGNFVLYDYNAGSPTSLWATSTEVQKGSTNHVEISYNGNVMVKNDHDDILWHSHTANHSTTQPHHLVVIDKCAYLMDKNQSVLWSEGICNCTHPPFEPSYSTVSLVDHVTTPNNGSLKLQNTAIYSLSLTTRLKLKVSGAWSLQLDQTCVNKNWKQLWQSDTKYDPIDFVEISITGNIMLKNNNGTVYWESGTAGHSATQPHHLVVTDECAYLMNSEFTVLWNEGSGCNTPLPTFAPPTIAPTMYPTIDPTKNPTTTSPTYITSNIFPHNISNSKNTYITSNNISNIFPHNISNNENAYNPMIVTDFDSVTLNSTQQPSFGLTSHVYETLEMTNISTTDIGLSKNIVFWGSKTTIIVVIVVLVNTTLLACCVVVYQRHKRLKVIAQVVNMTQTDAVELRQAIEMETKDDIYVGNENEEEKMDELKPNDEGFLFTSNVIGQ